MNEIKDKKKKKQVVKSFEDLAKLLEDKKGKKNE
jgi:hypothetical protein